MASGAAETKSAESEEKHEGVVLRVDSPSKEGPIMRIRNVHKTYLLGIEGVPALRGVSLSIRRGEFVVILGKSGCGKTSLLNVIGTIDTPTRGDLVLFENRITSETRDLTLASLRLRHIAFVFQTFNLLPQMTALENVELPMVLQGTALPSERRRRATELLDRVGMAGRLSHLPSQLSGGEQQRVTIARALANKPELLLLDEPTGDLDTRNSDIVMQLLTQLCAKDGVSLVMVTHDVATKVYADRVVHMLDGKVQRVETVPEPVRTEAVVQLNERLMGRADKPAEIELAHAPTSISECRQTVLRRPVHYGEVVA